MLIKKIILMTNKKSHTQMYGLYEEQFERKDS